MKPIYPLIILHTHIEEETGTVGHAGENDGNPRDSGSEVTLPAVHLRQGT